MEFGLWPVALRTDLVRAFRPGESSTREAPFRTLREHDWATAGVSVHLHDGRHAAGKLVLFSILNVEAAISARSGDAEMAVELARAAERLEKSRWFKLVQSLLADLPATDVVAFVEGAAVPGSAKLSTTLRMLALQTERVRHQKRFARRRISFHVGQISRVEGEYVVITSETESSVAVPRGLARAAHRERIGECLAVINSQPDERELIVRAVPGIDLRSPVVEGFSPFARSPGFEPVSRADVAYLRGRPAPLTIRFPVTIES